MRSTETPAASSLTSETAHTFTEINTLYDAKHEVAWCIMQPQTRPCFTPLLLKELNLWTAGLELTEKPFSGTLRYHVIASKSPGVFNLGGDLALFARLVQAQDKTGLEDYAKACIDPLYRNLTHFGRDVTTISLVQGDALGGGFETAMSSDVLIAEHSAQFGLPEIMFNLFPGMGAYNLLCRKLTPAKAERIISCGKLFSASELYDMGIVDVVAEDGCGDIAVYDYIRRENRFRNGMKALREVKDYCRPILYQDLAHITDIWVNAALRLERRDLRMMTRLVSLQSQKKGPVAHTPNCA